MAKWIYLINVLGKIGDFLRRIPNIIVVSLLIGVVLLFLINMLLDLEGKTFNPFPFIKKFISKKIIIGICILYSLSFFIPTKEEMYIMFASSFVTKENYNLTKDEIKNIIGEISNGIKTLKKESGK
jgi:hypothetical protein